MVGSEVYCAGLSALLRYQDHNAFGSAERAFVYRTPSVPGFYFDGRIFGLTIELSL